jgi:hypothetical protein
MGLSEIAAGLEVTTEQRERGVAAVDRTDAALADRLEPYETDLPCDAATAATLVEAYAAGRSVGSAARVADLAPMRAAKTLYRLGESVSPLGPTGRSVVQDWIAGELSRSEALTLTRVSEAEFALAAYVETHDPIPGARAAVEGALTRGGDAAAAKRDSLEETMSDVADLR